MTCPRSQLWNKGIKIGISLQLLVLALFGGPLTQIFKVPHLLLDSLLYSKTKLTAFCTLCLVPGSESWFPPHPWAVAAMGRGRFGFGLFGLVFLFFLGLGAEGLSCGLVAGFSPSRKGTLGTRAPESGAHTGRCAGVVSTYAALHLPGEERGKASRHRASSVRPAPI